MGGLPHARFLRFTSLSCDKEVKNKPTKVRKLCSHSPKTNRKELPAMLHDLTLRKQNIRTFSVCAENPTGEKGKGGMATEGYMQKAARELGQKWKVSPCVGIKAGEVFEMANIEQSGVINHIWLTVQVGFDTRMLIIRMYWDDSEIPAVECPLGDFFATAKEVWQISSLPVCVNSNNAYNCYWKMPFKKNCKITVENLSSVEVQFFYQVDYELSEVAEDALYFHSQFRRVNPIKYMDDIPASVSINEAVELAKKYATSEDASFINGILSTVVKKQ